MVVGETVEHGDDFGQRKPDLLRRSDDRQSPQHHARIPALPSIGPGRADQAVRLVKSEGRHGQPGALGDSSDRQLLGLVHNLPLTYIKVEVLTYRVMQTFTTSELDYLAGQRLARLATIDPSGGLQNNPVGFNVAADGTVVVGGWNLSKSRKFRNIAGNGHVALVVDDIASVDPWRVRGVEIRGTADAESSETGRSGERIVIHPDRVISWGLDQPAAS